eukprot:COSAG02_NODE_21474_length_786_cov_2.663755_2_plen_50_part_01
MLMLPVAPRRLARAARATIIKSLYPRALEYNRVLSVKRSTGSQNNVSRIY